jgi:hypothetical protein
MRQLLLCLAAFSLLSACVIEAETSTKNEKYEVNGLPADEYFAQFEYSEDENGSWGRTLVSPGVTIRELEGRIELRASLRVYLLDDGEAFVAYEESVGCATDDSGWQGEAVTYQKTRARWSVEQTNLVLKELGKGSGLEYFDHIPGENEEGEPAVSFKLEKQFRSPESAPRAYLLRQTSTTLTLERAVDKPAFLGSVDAAVSALRPVCR